MHATGDIYEGAWVNNKANGFGVYTTRNGARYEGYWRDDHQNGEGVEILVGGAKYLEGLQKGRHKESR